MKITVIGAGAIGGISGAYLTRAGRDVTLIEPFDEHRERIRRGVHIDGVRGEMHIPLDAVSPDELAGPLELVFMAVKSGKTDEALVNLKPFVGPDTLIVSLQNGINEDKIASVFGRDRTLGCVVGWGATFVAAGHLTQTSEGKSTLGELNGEMTERLNMIKSVLDDITETSLTANLYGHRWTKLSINCLIAGCSVLGLTVGEALAPDRNKRLFIRLVREVVEVAGACGVVMEKHEGVVDPSIFKATDREGTETCFRILDMMAAVHGRIKPGPLQDIEKGLKTEVDYVTGYCVDRAIEKNVPAPLNSKVRELIKGMEDGKVASPDNLALLENAAGLTA